MITCLLSAQEVSSLSIAIYIVIMFLLPATKLGQGNIFKSVCQEFWGGEWVVSQHALQVSRPTPRGEVERSGLDGRSPGPHPWGVSRPTPRGIPACTEADTPSQQMATAAGGTHPTGMHSCFNFKKYKYKKNVLLSFISVLPIK